MTGGLILLAIVVLPAIAAVVLYNGLVMRRNAFRNAFGQIDVQVKRRHDLVPNLVATAREYLRHERETLDAVIRARGAAASAAQAAAARPGDAGAMQAMSGAEAALTGSLSRLLAVAEAYPDLKADATMAALMEELSSSENRIAFARQAFNDSVMDYNTARESFPAVLVAGSLGFRPAAQYEVESSVDRQPVQVAF
jgi:LemA protein